MASSSTWSSNGLVRNSAAPAFIARTVIGTSPCPVMKMIGRATPALREFLLKCQSAHAGQPHVEHEAARRIGPRGLHEFRRRRERRTSWPTDLSRLSSERRMDGSSSTTNTMALSSLMRLLLGDGQREPEDRTMRLVRAGPQPPAVRLDDRAADRQADADAFGFRRVKRLEHLLGVLRVQAAAGIAHFDEHGVRVVLP